MRRTAAAALLAAPLLLGFAAPAGANDGPCTFGLGCGGRCLKFFPRIHQHGPLFNYGPYYGYPPFEPYGPWDAYLRYTGPDPSAAGSGAYGWIHGNSPGHRLHDLGDRFHSRDGLLQGHGCRDGICGGGGLFHGHGGGLFHHKKGCSPCAAAAEAAATCGCATDRLAGVGRPEGSMAYYADSPLLTRPVAGGVVPAGFYGK